MVTAYVQGREPLLRDEQLFVSLTLDGLLYEAFTKKIQQRLKVLKAANCRQTTYLVSPAAYPDNRPLTQAALPPSRRRPARHGAERLALRLQVAGPQPRPRDSLFGCHPLRDSRLQVRRDSPPPLISRSAPRADAWRTGTFCAQVRQRV